MLFNSYEFIFLFLPITLIVYFLLNKFKKYELAKGWLVVASLYFYSYFHYSYLILILSSIIVNYLIGKQLGDKNHNQNKRKVLLTVGLIFNIGLLGYFKYFDFFIANINFIFKANIPLLNILLPLGISFFTFQQISFIVDMYKEKELKYDFLDYSLFVCFFPQLIAGPIVLPSEMLPQFEKEKNKTINWYNINKGLYIFAIGLAKKVILADTLSNFVNIGFDLMPTLNIVEAWLSSISYTLQLYFDFSGYCDMAMGVALMFNIVLPINFDSPYKSINFQEFWKKWHITLGRFMTNYLYIPLGGNRKGEAKTLRNLFIVFLVSGIWHGAGWNFIIWGMLHGMCILIHRIWKNRGYQLNRFLGWIITFNLVNIFWIFFRATTLNSALKVVRGMFNIESLISFNISDFTLYFDKWAEITYLGRKIDCILLFFSIVLVFYNKNSINKMKKMKYSIVNSIEMNIFFWGSVSLLVKISPFLYFNF